MKNLKEIKEQHILKINGLENIDLFKPNLFVVNHIFFMDLFFLTAALNNFNVVSVVSSRTVFRDEPTRKRLMNKFAKIIPIEIRAGKNYTEYSLKKISELLENNINVIIYPQGVYSRNRNEIAKPRTGASRILYKAKELGLEVNLVPVALNIEGLIKDEREIDFSDLKVEISFLNPIDYKDSFVNYQRTKDNNYLHLPLDEGFKNIAKVLNKTYKDEYLKTFAYPEIIWFDGSIKSKEELQSEEMFKQFQEYLDSYTDKLIKDILENR